MNFRSCTVSVTAVCAALFLISCAKVPQTEIKQAQAALDSAKAVEADKYVAADYNAAQDSLKAAQEEIAKQKSGSAFGRSYDKAKATLAAAIALAEGAKAKAADEKAKIQAQADSAIAKATASEADANELLKKAPKGKEGKAALDAMQNEIATADASIKDADAAKASGDFAGALDKATAAGAKLDSIKTELNTAIEKTSKPAKGHKKHK